MDGSYQLLAAQYLRRQTRQLAGQLDGARKAEDIECVHQARVASRRLRAGLSIFPDCFARKKVKRWRKEIRRLAEGLGAARDKDVQIEFVGGTLAGLEQKANRPGIARLLLRLEQNRRAIQPQVVKAADRFESSGVARQMLAAARKARSKLKKRNVSLQSPFVFSLAEEHVCARLNELMQYEDSLRDPGDVQHHHAMRIAGKRLRYTVEVFQPVYEGRLDEFVKALKKLQLLLGDLHDCDVWVEHLQTFLDEERERTIAYYGHARPFRQLAVGLEYLCRERQDHRQEVFGRLVESWEGLNRRGFWEQLVRTAQCPAEPPAAAELPREQGSPKSQRKPQPAAQGGDGKPLGESLKGQVPRSGDRSTGLARPDERAGGQTPLAQRRHAGGD